MCVVEMRTRWTASARNFQLVRMSETLAWQVVLNRAANVELPGAAPVWTCEVCREHVSDCWRRSKREHEERNGEYCVEKWEREECSCDSADSSIHVCFG